MMVRDLRFHEDCLTALSSSDSRRLTSRSVSANTCSIFWRTSSACFRTLEVASRKASFIASRSWSIMRARVFIAFVLFMFISGFTKCSVFSFPGVRLLGEASPPSTTKSLSGNFDFDLFGFGFFALGQMHPEHAVLELRDHFVGIRVVRDDEAPLEAAVGALDAMKLLVLLFLLGFALAGDGEHTVLDGDLYVLLLHLGKLSL